MSNNLFIRGTGIASAHVSCILMETAYGIYSTNIKGTDFIPTSTIVQGSILAATYVGFN
jgi:hypothetical protein